MAARSLEFRDVLLVLDQGVNARHGGADARLHHVFGELFLVEDHDFFDVAHAALQVFAEGHDFADHDGRARDGLEHAHLAALDALGDFHFAFAREQRNGAHLAQIHADGVVGFFQSAGRQVELDVLALLELEVLVAAEFGPVEQVDALGADGGDQVVDVVGRGGHLIRHHLVDVAVGEVALFLARIDQAVNVFFEFVVNRQINPAFQVAAEEFSSRRSGAPHARCVGPVALDPRGSCLNGMRPPDKRFSYAPVRTHR